MKQKLLLFLQQINKQKVHLVLLFPKEEDEAKEAEGVKSWISKRKQ